jgi:hypothetical protein
VRAAHRRTCRVWYRRRCLSRRLSSCAVVLSMSASNLATLSAHPSLSCAMLSSASMRDARRAGRSTALRRLLLLASLDGRLCVHPSAAANIRRSPGVRRVWALLPLRGGSPQHPPTRECENDPLCGWTALRRVGAPLSLLRAPSLVQRSAGQGWLCSDGDGGQRVGWRGGGEGRRRTSRAGRPRPGLSRRRTVRPSACRIRACAVGWGRVRRWYGSCSVTTGWR